MSDLKKASLREQVQRSRIEKFIENSKKTATAKRTKAFYETKLEEFKRIWVEYKEADINLTNTFILEAPETATIPEDNYVIVEAKYSEYLSELLEGYRKFTTTETQPTQPAVLRQETILPRIDLPKFDGDYDKWYSFHDLFVTLIHNNTHLNAVQKLHHLKSCLVGDAEKLLRHIPVTNENYESSWIKVKERYENKRILVNHHLKTLLNQPKLNMETATALKTFISTTDDCLQQVTNLHIDIKSWDILLIHILIQKLPFVTLKIWEEEQGASQDLPTYKQFHTFLCKRQKILESISDIVTTKQPPQTSHSKTNTRVHHAIQENRCSACQERHWLQQCDKYTNMNPIDRRKVVTTGGHCYNCLSKGHVTKQCRSKFRCFKCKGKHHTTLHEDTRAESASSSSTYQQPKHTNTTSHSHRTSQATSDGHTPAQQQIHQQSKEVTESNNLQAFITRRSSHTLLSTALVYTRGSNGEQHTIRCLLDTGSESSFITQKTCKKLGATYNPAIVRISGLNTSPTGRSTKQTRLILESRTSNNFQMSETFLVVNKITDVLPTTTISIDDCQHLQDLELADPGFWKPGNIDALLGADAYAKILQDGIRRGSESSPVAINTSLGWIVFGSTGRAPTTSSNNFTIQITNEDLSNQLKQFWEEEELPTRPSLTQEEQECANCFADSHKRLKNGQYQVKLPFKHNKEPKLGDSRGLALKRFHCLERRLNNDAKFKKEYEACLNEYIQLGHMIETRPPIANEPNYYIPHHAVMKDSSTTKLRVVFDASAKTTNGQSLNDCLLPGPTIQAKLICTLLKWRKHKIAVHADIEKMYRMIKIAPEHQTYQRILWRHPSHNNVQDYILTTATFGTTSAPYLAIRTLKQLAIDERQNFPLASKATESDFYVDDLLTGADDIDTALKLQEELITMLKSGGFNLRKWSSNERTIIEHLPMDYRELKGSVSFTETDSIKTLGVRWHPHSDQFTFEFNLQRKHNTITKRTILSDVASLYDPLGLLQPIIIIAKMLIQDLWVTGCSWDEPVPEHLKTQWIHYKEDLQQINKFTIPRWIHYSSRFDMQLHGFCDASIRAIAAVIYLRVIDDKGNITSTLITSRTRVAPIKPVTIPRLELNSALLLTRLMKEIVSSTQLQGIPLFAWTDSTIVLQWIRQHAARWKTYVANRVVEIQENIKYDRWKHISTHCNPADLASRGTTASNLIDNQLWLAGPPWLIKRAEEWPNSTIPKEETTLERKETTTNLINKIEEDIILRYSSFTRLIRIVAMIQRFLYNTKHPTQRKAQAITVEELKQAETTILKQVQQNAFYREYHNLQTNKQLSPSSKLLMLNPFVDKDGLLRVGGRLRNATISYEQKHPIIIPRDHHVTNLIIDKTHLETLHGGVSLVLAITRNKYWLLDGRRCITSRLHKCVICARYRQGITHQLMGELPQCRTTIAKPFTNTGVDFAGPFNIKTAKHRNAKIQKGYICIFVCMTTKAIHIELASDLTSETFIAAFKRFIARRGKCSNIYSDCGTNFVGGRSLLEKELRQTIKESSPDVGKYLSTLSINWHFNPPAAPHFGGLWEAGVKSIKYHIKRTMGKSICTYEEFTTVLNQIEACLNSRPMCYIPNKTDDPLILTPAHFLIGQSLFLLPEPEEGTSNASLKQRWQHTRNKTQHFWNKWSKDYLNQLQHRPKWQQRKSNIQPGQVVLLKGETTTPALWPLGIIEEIYPGDDGLVRVVRVRTQFGDFKRPVTKICPLSVES